MASKTLAEINLAEKAKLEKITLSEEMWAKVELEDQSLLKNYDKKDENIILQSMIEAALDAAQAARDEVTKQLEKYDKEYRKRAWQSEEGVEAEEQAINRMCRKLTSEQEAKMKASVEAVWKKAKDRDRARTKLNVKFAVSVTQAVVSIGISAASLALSMGTSLPLTIVSLVKTVGQLALAVKAHAEGRDDALAKVRKLDEEVLEIYKDESLKVEKDRTATNKKEALKRVLATAGVPFLKTAKNLKDANEVFQGKSADMDKKRQEMFVKAKVLMSDLKKAKSSERSKATSEKLDALIEEVGNLFDGIGEFEKLIKADDNLYVAVKARCKTYEQMEAPVIALKAEQAKTLVAIRDWLKNVDKLAGLVLH